MQALTWKGGAAALALLAGTAQAQIPAGTAAPEFAIDSAWNDGPRAFADLKGRAVLFEFFATW